jgi:polygalacturonase
VTGRHGSAGAIALAVLFVCPAARGQTRAGEADPWARLPDVLARIVPPRFPARECRVAGHGCRADGRADCSEAIRAAIEECRRVGGGRVVIPAGDVLTGRSA